MCYSPLEASLAATKYFIHKHSQDETFTLSDETAFTKNSNDFFGILSVYNYILHSLKDQDPEKIEFFTKDDIHETRKLLFQITKLPDVLIDCINDSSTHTLCEWLAETCEVYMILESAFKGVLKDKAELLMKLIIEEVLELLTIPTHKLYKN